MTEEMIDKPETDTATLEDLDREMIIEESGVPQEKIDSWKKHFSVVGAVKVGGTVYFYRALTRSELRDIRREQGEAAQDDLVFQEKLCTRCVLHPKMDAGSIDGSAAGLASTLAGAIWDASGYVPDSEPIRL